MTRMAPEARPSPTGTSVGAPAASDAAASNEERPVLALAASPTGAARVWGPSFDDLVLGTVATAQADLDGRAPRLIAVATDELADDGVRWALAELQQGRTAAVVVGPTGDSGPLQRMVAEIDGLALSRTTDQGYLVVTSATADPHEPLQIALDDARQRRTADAWESRGPSAAPASSDPPAAADAARTDVPTVEAPSTQSPADATEAAPPARGSVLQAIRRWAVRAEKRPN